MRIHQKICFLVNVDWFYLSHRKALADKFLENNFKVSVIAGKSKENKLANMTTFRVKSRIPTLFGLFILKETHSLGRWASILCGLVGCILVVELDLNLVTFDYYDLFGFTSGFIWSLGSVIVRRYENIEITSTFLPIYFFGACITLIFIMFFKFEMPSVNVIAKTSIPIFLVSILIFFPTFLILLRINQYLSPGLIGILMLSELIVAAISANILLGEPMSSWQWLGAILIVIAGLTVALLEGKETDTI